MDGSVHPSGLMLGDGLRLRSVADGADVEAIARFNREIHGDGVDAMSRELMLRHPAARPEYWIVVEDTATEDVVSALCLLPWTLHYDGVEIRSAEMGIVGTADAYRRRGLVRHLNTRFSQLIRDGGFVMSHIQGIGVFYRQFGYDYAMPLEADWRMEPYLVAQTEAERYTFRQATVADIERLMQCYDEANALLDISAARDVATWRYLLGPSTQTATAAETWIVEAAGTPHGYVRLNRHGFGTGLIVGEASQLPVDAARATLGWLNTVAGERGKPYIRFNLPTCSSLLTLARACGAHDAGAYAWQVRIPDVVAFIRAIAPVLERRVARSPFGGTTRTFRLDLGREIIALHWEAGRLADVGRDATAGGGDLRLLPQLVGPLMLGYRSRDDLRHAYPDVGADGEAGMFTDVLWPPMAAFLYTQY